MNIMPIPVLLCLAGVLAGCYGTKPPPPQHSSTPPPGLGGVASGPDVVAVPADLPGLLAAYERLLIADSHQLSNQTSRRYAILEIQSLTTRYAGRDDELKRELAKRLRASESRPPPPRTPTEATISVYPVDPSGEQGRGNK